jgi:two-component system sensor histidine kinase DesK
VCGTHEAKRGDPEVIKPLGQVERELTIEGPRLSRARWLALSAPWLLYLLYPVSSFLGGRHSPVEGALALLFLAAFLAVYAYLWQDPVPMPDSARNIGALVLLVLSVAAYIILRLPDALAGIIYMGPVLSYTRSWGALAGTLALATSAILVPWALGLISLGMAATVLFPFYAVFLALRGYGQFWRQGARLRMAEREVRELAVQNERLAISRDLHDLVGHNLSVLALRAELAAQQAEKTAPEAAAEMRLVADLSRQALRDVREAVSRWRSVTLRDEWSNARLVLEAAGLDVVGEPPDDVLPPEVDRALGFFIREATTNILRHSTASRCHLRVSAGDGRLSVSLADNGRPRSGFSRSGSGIDGIRERFMALGGSLREDHTPAGFTLSVELPLPSPYAMSGGGAP